MGLEIERKFLVKGDFKSLSYQNHKIVQGYISTDPKNTVRIRTVQNVGRFITIKGIGNESGVSRYEWEHEISHEDAKNLLTLCGDRKIEKTRYRVNNGVHDFEVDVFEGDNEGLVIAEIELYFEDEEFEKPDWLGDEVTGDVKYYNSSLIENPFKNW